MIGSCAVKGEQLTVEWHDGEVQGSQYLLDALRIFIAEWPSSVPGPEPMPPTAAGLATAIQARNTIGFVLGLIGDEGTVSVVAPELDPAIPDPPNVIN